MTPSPPARPPLAVRLGVDVPAGLAAELAERLEDATETALAMLRAAGRIPASAPRDARCATLALPRSVAEVLAVTIADARASGRDDHAELLALHYLESLPVARLEQLLTARAPERWLFHEPVPWAALPRFRRGLARLYTLLAQHGLDATAALGAPDPDAFCAARPTLADLYLDAYYGALMPLFTAQEPALARLEADVAGAPPARRWAEVDRRLGNAILHEILHFGRGREAIFPPYLDEAIAAHLGLLLDEGVAFPAPGDDDGLVGWPWFSQVGEALARALGDGPLLAAQAGLVPWPEALPPALLDALEREAFAAYRAAPAVHFHPDTTRPDRWVQRIWELAPPPPDPARDHTLLVHALSAMCLVAEPRDGALYVVRRAPDGPVTLDFAAGVVVAPPRRAPPGGPSPYEPAPALHVLPPPLVGPRPPRTLVLDPDPAALAALARALLADPIAGWCRP